MHRKINPINQMVTACTYHVQLYEAIAAELEGTVVMFN